MIEQHLRNSSILARVAAAVAVPIVGLVIACAVMVADGARTLSDMSILRALAGLADSSSDFVHDFQKERGATAVYLGSKGQQMGDQLGRQALATDGALKVWAHAMDSFDTDSLGPAFGAKVRAAREAVGRVATHRQQVSALAMTPREGIGYYTTTVSALLALVSEVGLVSKDVDVANAVAGYVAFMNAKEKAGQERAIGAAGFAAGGFDTETYVRLVKVIAEQNSFVQSFESFASPEQKAFRDQSLSGSTVDEVERMRRIAIERGAGVDLMGVSGPVWFASTTQRIDLMKQVEDRIAADLVALVDDTYQSALVSLLQIVAGLVVGLAVIATVATLVVRSFTRPLSALTGEMVALSQGNKSVVITGAGFSDEIAAMARALSVFRDAMVRADDLAIEQARERAAREERAKAVDGMVVSFDAEASSGVKVLGDVAGRMEVTAREMARLAQDAAVQAAAAASATEQATTNVETAAAAAEELSSSIAEIARQVASSTVMSSDAVQAASRADALIQGLATAADRIGHVVTIIDQIASQTNLLALNATIEAARAGESGKGFAVVAGEVKNLANQTAKATSEITEQISSVQDATGQAVRAVQDIGGIITRLSEVSAAIATAVEEQDAATQEIARAVQEAAMGTRSVSANVSSMAQGVGRTQESATIVLEQAGTVTQRSTVMRGGIDQFLKGVRAA